MEYPIFDVPLLGGSLLIASMAVFHVFIAHFSVGSGFLLALAERRALRDGDEAMRSALRKYAFAVLLIPYVLGTVTGVGIWFTIALVSPRAVSTLIHQFVWDWAIEWVLFLLEGVAIYVYVFRWERMDGRAHNRVGWIFALSSVATLLVINGILSFMLTPGSWRPFDAGTLNYKGLLNPTYLPTSLARVLISLALAGVAGVVLASLDRGMAESARRKLVALSYRLIVPAILCIPLGLWTFTQLSRRAQTFLLGGAAPMVLFLGFGVASTVILCLAAAVSLLRKDHNASSLGGVLLCLLSFVAFGAMEFLREGVRKPYVIEGFMYSTGVTVVGEEIDGRACLARTRARGVLSAAPWALPAGRDAASLAPAARGRAVYRAACLRCHSVDGYNAMRPLVTGWSAATIRGLLDHMDEIKPAMPPFPGTTGEKDALAAYLRGLANSRDSN
ncbi:MAG TPA: cytochrome ubiquinol oxidase subunit I [Phycisphaerae bacterium]|nr:cytochrome ubiquinol oxidase subunit I [Phycisphaerae bacterium]